jgi:hypothetical protein
LSTKLLPFSPDFCSKATVDRVKTHTNHLKLTESEMSVRHKSKTSALLAFGLLDQPQEIFPLVKKTGRELRSFRRANAEPAPNLS